MTTFTYPNTAQFVGNRPYTDVLLNPSFRGGLTHKCLVDTGADYLQLPASSAPVCGLSLAGAASIKISTASGSTAMKILYRVDVKIENAIVTVDVLFDITNKAPAIAGRQLLLAAFDIGLDTTAWFWT